MHTSVWRRFLFICMQFMQTNFERSSNGVRNLWLHVCIWCYVRVVYGYTNTTDLGLYFMTGWIDWWKDGRIVIRRLIFREGGGGNERLRWWRSRRAEIMNLAKKTVCPLIPPHNLLLVDLIQLFSFFLLLFSSISSSFSLLSSSSSSSNCHPIPMPFLILA